MGGDANAAITREATPCVISGCSSEEALNTQSITSQICALVAAGGSSGGSSAALPPPHPLLRLFPVPPALLPLLPPPWPHPWLHPCQVLPALLPALSPRLPPQLHPPQSRPPTLLPRRRLVASWPVLLSLLPSLCK